MHNQTIVPQDARTHRLLVEVLTAMTRHYLEQKRNAASADEFGDQVASPKITPTAEAGRADIIVPAGTVSNKEIEE